MKGNPAVAQPTIPGYSDLEPIGSGGFASVYRATNDESGQLVAIKVLHAHTSNSADLLRFERERTTMRALNGHPNIVDILDEGKTDDEQHFTVLEYVSGGSVRDHLSTNGALHWSNTVEIGVQICASIDIAHRSGVLHRDVKPANILLEDNTAKLTDFGIARLIGQSNVTAAQSIIGTLAYTPPEVFHNKPFDGRGDIYQLGISLYEMLLGRAPFTSSVADNKATIIRRILDIPAPPLAQFDVPQQLSDLLDEVLAKDPADRPQTAEKFGRRLNQIEVALGRTPTDLHIESPSARRNTEPLRNSAIATPPTPSNSANTAPTADTAPTQSNTPADDLTISLEPPTPEPDNTTAAATTAAAAAAAATTDDDNSVEWPAFADTGPPDVPAAPEVEPPVDANITVAEPRPGSPTSVLSPSNKPSMSLGTPGSVPAHFDDEPVRTPAPTVQPAKPRRWPWVLLLVGLIGAGVAGAFAVGITGDTATDLAVESANTTTPAEETPNSEPPPEADRQFAAIDDPAFLEPLDAEHAVIFDVVRNSQGLTMVGGAGASESTDDQQPMVWTIGNNGSALQRAFERGGRLRGVGVSRDDFLAVGDTAGTAGTDGLAVIGGQASQLVLTESDTFAGSAAEGLRTSAFDAATGADSFLVGGQTSANGIATLGLWSVRRPSADATPVWTQIDVGGRNAGSINAIDVDGETAIAVGTERNDSGQDLGLILIRREVDGAWSNLIRPFDNTIFHGAVIAGDRIIAVGESGDNARTPIAIVSSIDGQGWFHQLPISEENGLARSVTELENGRVIAVGDMEDADDPTNRRGAIWELLANSGDLANDNWTTRVSSDLPRDQYTELRTIDEWNNTVYIFGRTEADGRRPAGAWTLNLDLE